jgi:hypothetical protein
MLIDFIPLFETSYIIHWIRKWQQEWSLPLYSTNYNKRRTTFFANVQSIQLLKGSPKSIKLTKLLTAGVGLFPDIFHGLIVDVNGLDNGLFYFWDNSQFCKEQATRFCRADPSCVDGTLVIVGRGSRYLLMVPLLLRKNIFLWLLELCLLSSMRLTITLLGTMKDTVLVGRQSDCWRHAVFQQLLERRMHVAGLAVRGIQDDGLNGLYTGC